MTASTAPNSADTTITTPTSTVYSSAGTDAQSATSPSSFIDFLLAGFRVAGLRAQIIANEIEAMTIALSAGMISAETALLHLHETGALALVPTSSAWGMQ